jgi:hypothetical protein
MEYLCKHEDQNEPSQTYWIYGIRANPFLSQTEDFFITPSKGFYFLGS